MKRQYSRVIPLLSSLLLTVGCGAKKSNTVREAQIASCSPTSQYVPLEVAGGNAENLRTVATQGTLKMIKVQLYIEAINDAGKRLRYQADEAGGKVNTNCVLQEDDSIALIGEALVAPALTSVDNIGYPTTITRDYEVTLIGNSVQLTGKTNTESSTFVYPDDAVTIAGWTSHRFYQTGPRSFQLHLERARTGPLNMTKRMIVTYDLIANP